MTPQESKPGRAGQLEALTGIRIIAALWVLVFHFSQIDVDKGINYSFGILNPLVRRGYLGVDIFFVLSGFILMHVYRTRFINGVGWHSWRDFLKFRIARLYPVHLISMVMMACIFLVAARSGFHPHKAEAFTRASLLANLTMTHVWFSGVAAMNTPAWSISAEWFAYLWFPVVCCLIVRWKSIWLGIPALAAIATALLIPEWPPLLQIAAEFTLGLCTYEAALRFPGRFRTRWGSLLCLIGAIAVIYILPDLAVPAVMIASAYAFVSLSAATDVSSPMLSSPLLIYGGEISYSLYMFHWVVWSIVRRGMGVFFQEIQIPHLELMAVATILSLAVAAAAYRWIELPGRRLLRGSPAEIHTRSATPAQTATTSSIDFLTPSA